jgi:4-amino-4-deoxy-L-arabinose transferase-like glycosyltransferase
MKKDEGGQLFMKRDFSIIGVYKNLSNRYAHLDIVILFLLAIGLRLLTIGLIPIVSPDTYQYIIQESIIHNENFQIATHIVNGEGYSHTYGDGILRPTSMMPPLYPYFLSLFLYLCRDTSLAFLVVSVVQSLIVSLAIFPLYAISNTIFNKKVAIMSSLLFIFYPIFIIQVLVIHQLNFEILCSCLLVYLLLRIKDNFASKEAIYLGIMLGISTLVNPVFFSFLPVIAIWSYFTCVNIPKRKIVKSLFVIFIISFLIITPWTIRNYNVYGEFVFMKSTGAYLYHSNNPDYTESGIPSGFPEIDNKTGYPHDHPYYGKKMKQMAINYMISNPIITIKNSLQKFYYFWWFPKTLPEQTPIIRRITYLPLLLLGIFGIIITMRRFKEVSVLYIPLISFSFSYSIFFVLPRFRILILPIFFVFSAYAMFYLFERIFFKTKRG